MMIGKPHIDPRPAGAALEDELSGTLRGAAPIVEQLSRLPLLEGDVPNIVRLEA
jgi:hypothetical protein